MTGAPMKTALALLMLLAGPVAAADVTLEALNAADLDDDGSLGAIGGE